ncbi:MAG: hypothetical protein H7138_18260, partial [Myxococcales bacterium]|nr:hypothetical protein [Myxococcales bacterium]
MHRTLATLLVATGGVVAGLFGSLLGNRVQRGSDPAETPAIHATAPDGVTLADWQRARLTR